MTEEMLLAFLDHGKVRQAVLEGLDEADQVLSRVAAEGIDLHEIGIELVTEGVAAFQGDFEGLLAEIEKAMRNSLHTRVSGAGR